MQYPRDEYALRLNPEKDDVAALFHAAQTGSDPIARPASGRTVGKPLAGRLQIAEVAGSLIRSPRAECVDADIHQVCLGEAGKAECGHRI
jgi:hypothetical protein